MIPIEKILTHPGGAHKDEFLACSVLLARHAVPLLRREPLPADLADPATAVVDVGHLHQPELNNFDHHQLPKETPPTCSLSLVLQHLGLYEDTREFCEWLEPTEWFDCRGPDATSRWLGIDRQALNKLNSPIDITLLRRFAAAQLLEPGTPLWEVMRMIGQDLVDYVQSLRARLNFIAQHAQVWDLESSNGSPDKVLFMPRTDPVPDEPSLALERYIEQRGLAQKVIAMVYPDRRSAGYGLSRYRDNQKIDFTRITGDPLVHFAHARGFVAKTSATDQKELRRLLELSVIS